MRLIWLVQAKVAEALLPFAKDNMDLDLKLNNIMYSGYMLFDNPDMLPPEKLEEVLTMGRLMVIIAIFVVSSMISSVIMLVM